MHLNPSQSALFFDIDGTLIDIAPHPDAVQVPDQLKTDLARLNEKLDGALAFISGRTIDAMDRLFHPLRLAVAGAHGAQWRVTPHAPIEQLPPLDADFRAMLKREAERRGAYVEDKTHALALHYRDKPAIKKDLDDLITQTVPSSVQIIAGKMVFDIVSATIDKGQALDRFMRHPPFQGRTPYYFGDDTTDLSAIDCALRLGGQGTLITPQSPTFPTPHAVRTWIARLANE